MELKERKLLFVTSQRSDWLFDPGIAPFFSQPFPLRIKKALASCMGWDREFAFSFLSRNLSINSYSFFRMSEPSFWPERRTQKRTKHPFPFLGKGALAYRWMSRALSHRKERKDRWESRQLSNPRQGISLSFLSLSSSSTPYSTFDSNSKSTVSFLSSLRWKRWLLTRYAAFLSRRP